MAGGPITEKRLPCCRASEDRLCDGDSAAASPLRATVHSARVDADRACVGVRQLRGAPPPPNARKRVCGVCPDNATKVAELRRELRGGGGGQGPCLLRSAEGAGGHREETGGGLDGRPIEGSNGDDEDANGEDDATEGTWPAGGTSCTRVMECFDMLPVFLVDRAATPVPVMGAMQFGAHVKVKKNKSANYSEEPSIQD